ncbi:type II secretion system protein GspM [Acidiphilium sp.]|uniref:type II secretion system protein GspM n=1 Tax=Acidiphilium sp. TaxID=527 RepID=UPI00258C1DB9|nr:type II secretion system protein GspM [Acidiphilium sp.]
MKRADAMAQLPRDLPDGRAGQALALAISAALLALVGFGVIRPGLAWYRGLSTRVATVSTLLAHERRLVAELPALRRMAARGRPGAGRDAYLPGGSAAIAGARLQGAVQSLAATHRIGLDSAELLPPVSLGSVERIRLRISMTATYPALIGFLDALGAATPRMLVNRLDLHATGAPTTGADLPLHASFTVSGFRIAKAAR